MLKLSDRTEERLEPETLGLGERDALYCWVKGGQYEARFTPAAQVALAPHLAEGEGGKPAVMVAGTEYLVGVRGGLAHAAPGSLGERSNSEESTGFG